MKPQKSGKLFYEPKTTTKKIIKFFKGNDDYNSNNKLHDFNFIDMKNIKLAYNLFDTNTKSVIWMLQNIK